MGILSEFDVGPWLPYMRRSIEIPKGGKDHILRQLRESTYFKQEEQTSTIGDTIIECEARLRRLGNCWEYRLTNDSRRYLIRKLMEKQI